MIKKLIASAGVVAAVSTLLIGCASSDVGEKIITRKYIDANNDYKMWVKDITDGSEYLIMYRVEKDYWEKAEIGDNFDEQYKIGEGITEVEYNY